MSTTDYDEIAVGDLYAPAPSLWSRIRALFARRRRRKMQRLTLLELSRLDSHLLRDIGVHPADIEAALRGRRRSIWLNPLPRE